MDIITQIVSPLFSARKHEIDRFMQHPFEAQDKQLRYLLQKAKKTEWGAKYSYSSIPGYAAFAERVPVSTYEELYPYIERMINGEKDILWSSSVRWFAKSSGTTNDRSKYIPVTPEALHKCHYRGGFDAVALYLHNNPKSRLFSGKNLILGGSHSPSQLNSHAVCGDLSAVLIQNINPIVNLTRIPAKKIILMDEWEAKIKAIVAKTVHKDVASISGIPSWMLVLIKEILKSTGKEILTDVWQNLEVFFHGGVNFDPYRAQYQSLIPSDKMRYMETYNASEGFFGLQDDPDDRSMLLMLDYGVFFEFIPFNGQEELSEITPLEGVKTGVNYAMVISTAGGLWRYRLGDTVRFTSLFPHKFVITGRTKQFINTFGEELMVDNAEKGIHRACEQTGAVLKACTAAPLFLPDKGKGRHQWLIEFEKQPPSIEEFAKCLDSALQQLNSDYEAKRYREISLQQLEIIPAREGLFFDWMKKHNKLGGQHKVPCLSNNRELIEELIEMNIDN